MKILIIISLIINCAKSYSQNLIPNHSFELVDSCSFNNIPSLMSSSLRYYCKNWFDNIDVFSSSCDYLKNNCINPNHNVPNNYYGSSSPQSGSAYISMSLTGYSSFYPDFEEYREHISVLLKKPLVKDSVYCVSFYYKNARTLNKIYSTDNIGVLFTLDSLKLDTILQREANIRTTKGIPLDNDNWIEFKDYYIAKGGEKYFNLGMFGKKNESTLFFDNGSFSYFYYFIDNISVTLCNKDSIFNVYLELNANVFTPNGDGINDVYTIKYQNIAELNVQVYNRWGNLVRHYNGLTTEWLGNNDNGKPLSDGVYFIVVNAIDKFGETHQKTKTVTILRKL